MDWRHAAGIGGERGGGMTELFFQGFPAIELTLTRSPEPVFTSWQVCSPTAFN